MSYERSLFGEDPETPQSAEVAVSDAQLSSIREALDALRLITIEERKAVIERLAQREVESLRHLRPLEAQIILDRLRSQARRPSVATVGSAWQNRDGDTWIDRL